MTRIDEFAAPEEGRVVPTLLDYLQVLRRRRVMFLLAVVLVPAIAVVLSLRQAPTYEASAQVLLKGQSTQSQAATDPARAAQTAADLARVPAVATRAIQAGQVSNLSVSEFLDSSSVSPTLGSDLLTFSVTNSDPDIARRLATAYARAFSEYRHETLGTPRDRVVREADRATKVGPKVIRNEMIGLVLGLVLGLALAFLWDALDTRIRSVETLRDGLGLRLLGRLPSPPRKLRKQDRLVMMAAPMGHEAEAFRVLRASFDFANADYQARTIMVTSAVDGEGKSTTVANLAIALARAGRRVVLVDSDLRRPSLHRFFDLHERPGLIDVELGHVELEDALQPVAVAQPDSAAVNGNRPSRRRKGTLEVLTAGHALQAPDELGLEVTVARIAESLQDRADLVLVDAAPLLPVSDAIALSAHVDALVLVVRHNGLRSSAYDDLRRTLAASPARKLGFVLTGAETSDAYTQFYRYSGERGREAEPPVTYSSSRAPDE